MTVSKVSLGHPFSRPQDIINVIQCDHNRFSRCSAMFIFGISDVKGPACPGNDNAIKSSFCDYIVTCPEFGQTPA